MPLRVTKEEALLLLAYLKEYYSGAGSEKTSFRVMSVSMKPEEMTIVMEIFLTPAEAGITQEVECTFHKSDGRYILHVVVTRKSGDLNLWQDRSYSFLDDLRKQLLLWRSLPQEEREKYRLEQ